ETPWVPLPIDEAPPPLPKDYNFPSTRPGGKEVRNFNASVINKNYAASQGLNYNWDLNCDGKIDSVYAHTTRMIDPGGGLAICYVLDPVSNKTGVGLVEIAKLGQ
ncbi:MAG: hypothetical protein HY815_05590, partial [Candidatus Riflebacteria bacterium]|nr:hypothetical protein [Candidatus Riflebacteria bacterium]